MPSAKQVEWLVGALTSIRSAHGSDEETAKAIGVSRNGWKKWQNREAYPTEANLTRIQAVLTEVRARATKVAPAAPMGERAGLRVVPSAPRRDADAAATEREQMGALLASVGRPVGDHEPTYVLELEICLWYHREEVAAGKISKTAISAAREGYLEARGCVTWGGPQWWSELAAYDAELRDLSQRSAPKADKDPAN